MNIEYQKLSLQYNKKLQVITSGLQLGLFRELPDFFSYILWNCHFTSYSYDLHTSTTTYTYMVCCIGVKIYHEAFVPVKLDESSSM